MLTVVPTPIGNLQDITLRALDALRECDLVAAEDTRHSGLLLHHFGIKKPMVSFHQHNEAGRVAGLIEEMRQGRRVALVTDAGMPGISDPGWRLIHDCRAQGIAIEILPGPSAVLTALVGSGLPAHAFYFGGFLPVKSGQRRSELERAMAREESSVYFESPHRLLKTLNALAEFAPAARVCVARELTKKFEEFRTGSPAELSAHYGAHTVKGEITLVLAPPDERRVPSAPSL